MIKLKDTEKVKKALKEAQKSATVRVMTSERIEAFLSEFKSTLQVTNKEMHGTKIRVCIDAQDPHKYGGGPGRRSKVTYYPATAFTAEFKGNNWYIADIERTDGYTTADRVRFICTPEPVQGALRELLERWDVKGAFDSQAQYVYVKNVYVDIPAALDSRVSWRLQHTDTDYATSDYICTHAAQAYTMRRYNFKKVKQGVYDWMNTKASDMRRGYEAALAELTKAE